MRNYCLISFKTSVEVGGYVLPLKKEGKLTSDEAGSPFLLFM
jgi:hypothetical protein